MVLLLVQMVLLWFLLRPKRDWYVVDIHRIYGNKLASCEEGFGKHYLAAHNLTIQIERLRSTYMVDKDGGSISIDQKEFSELDAAKLYFDGITKTFAYGDAEEGRTTVYLRRIVARFRKKAVVLPPDTYSRLDHEVLQRFSSRPHPPEK